MPERIEFAKLLSPRELTHLVLGHRKATACVVFCGVIAVLWLVFTAWLWLPDPLRPRDVAGHGDGFGLDCGNLPAEASYLDCTAADTLLGNYRKAFASEPRFTVNFDLPPVDTLDSETSAVAEAGPYSDTYLVRASYAVSSEGFDAAPASKSAVKPRKKSRPAAAPKPAPKAADPIGFLKDNVCKVKHDYAMAKLDHGQVRFIYTLLARNEGKTCGAYRLGAQSRLVRTLAMSDGGIILGGALSVLLDVAAFALAAALIVLILLTRRSYLWLYGSYHVRRQK